ncbi:MAG: sugar ABC transporter permease [candidate division NC10 bacterium]|nr:sugar ABC transporter permease [candidate division NC10 bacterium]
MRRQTLLGYALILPSMAFFSAFYIYPVVYSFYLSFFAWDMLQPKRFIGLTNYRELLEAAEFQEVLGNTLAYSVGVVVLAMGIGLALALLLNNRTALSSLFQACIFTSYIVSWVAVSLLWIWMLDPQYGLVNYVAGFLGVPPVDWLGNHRLALWSLVGVTVWKVIGYPMIIFLAGLQNISQDYYEAASLDGASAWHQFRYITWPLLAPTTVFLFITLTIATFQGFDIVNIMTQGGPVHATSIYVFYIYEQAFHYFRIGRASAAVVICFALILTLTYVQHRVFQRKVHYTQVG